LLFGNSDLHELDTADPRIPEDDFRLARFAEGALLKTPYPYVGAGEMR
jgi:sarcosine oxidase subunit beta